MFYNSIKIISKILQHVFLFKKKKIEYLPLVTFHDLKETLGESFGWNKIEIMVVVRLRWSLEKRWIKTMILGEAMEKVMMDKITFYGKSHFWVLICVRKWRE